jgi:hypothetical protein
MDPYLESDMVQEFHATLANVVRGQLMRVLPDSYVALLNRRYVVDRTGLSIMDVPVTAEPRIVYPDVHVVSTPASSAAGTGSGVAVAVSAPVVEVPSPLPDNVPVLSVEVRDIKQRRLVTLIEILSPANKIGDGALEYAERRASILATRTHLLEIDLVRRGTRIQLLGDVPPAPYYVYLSRANRRPLTSVWPVGLRDRLPAVPVPLLPEDPDVALDLQDAVNECFAIVRYDDRLLDYAEPPPPPALAPEDATWVAQRVEAWRREHVAGA